jgi:hypothetical protein
MKAAAQTFLKGLIYAFAFWLLFYGVFRPLSSYFTSPSASDRAAEAQTQAQVKAYDEQLRRTSDYLKVTEEQQKRMDGIMKKQDTLLTEQEQLNRRMDAVLSAWEKQAKISR